jgi:hypothetical protein
VCGAELAPLVLLELAVPIRRKTLAPAPEGRRVRGGGTSLPPPTFNELQAGNRLLFWRLSRAPLILLLGWFTLSHLALGAQWVFIDNVNLLFHEAGHFLFSWGGDTISALGGTVGQLMWPVGFAVYFWWKQRNRFAAVVCVWWFGENLIGIALYMADAAFEELALVGGDVHDWNFLFGRWGLLSVGQEIGAACRWTGAIIMLAALALLARWTVAPAEADLHRDFEAS